jgi:hypothetical protein
MFFADENSICTWMMRIPDRRRSCYKQRIYRSKCALMHLAWGGA